MSDTGLYDIVVALEAERSEATHERAPGYRTEHFIRRGPLFTNMYKFLTVVPHGIGCEWCFVDRARGLCRQVALPSGDAHGGRGVHGPRAEAARQGVRHLSNYSKKSNMVEVSATSPPIFADATATRLPPGSHSSL
jgi:hypothetical protein